MRHIYMIEDGERHWISATSEDSALKYLATRIYCSSVEKYEEEYDPYIFRIPDDRNLKVRRDDNPNEFDEKTCGEWASEEDGLIASTFD